MFMVVVCFLPKFVHILIKHYLSNQWGPLSGAAARICTVCLGIRLMGIYRSGTIISHIDLILYRTDVILQKPLKINRYLSVTISRRHTTLRKLDRMYYRLLR